MTEFTQNVINLIYSIPKGKVMTYGGIARRCLNPQGARQVSYILHSMSTKYNLPWHRVINSRGKISLLGQAHNIQRQMLENEGVIFSPSGTIDLSVYEV